jgi:anti-sigma regulatory factor (Ser/Thr protein kinase)
MDERDFPRSFDSLESIYAFVRAFLAQRGLEERHAWDLDLILEELFTNMVKYGPGHEPIALGLEWRQPNVTLRLRDPGGPGFNPLQAPEVDVSRPILERRAGGLGIHLVRQYADHVEYTRDGGRDTIVITKKLGD